MTQYLTPDQVCKKLQVPITTLYKLTRLKRIPFGKVGRKLRFNEDEIDAWFKNKSISVSESLAF